MMGVHSFTQRQGKARSDAIDRQIKKDKSQNLSKVNILLLGTDPNMSMIVKQMKVAHGLTTDELIRHRLIIYQNSLDSAKELVCAIHSMGIQYVDPVNQVAADRILSYHIQHDPSFVFSRKIAMSIHRLLHDPVVSRFPGCQSKFSHCENAMYFLEEILRIGSLDYLPTNYDILRAGGSSRQAVDTYFVFGAVQLIITDVGRQNSRKWLSYFIDVGYIMFCVPLCDYDRVLEENQNQLNDSLIVFDSVVNSPRFLRPIIILCLTGIDEFRDKLSKVPLEDYFPEYSGGSDFNEAIKYMRSRFAQANRAKLPLYFTQCCGVDPTTPRAIFHIVREATLKDAWRDCRKKPSLSLAMRLLRLHHTFSSVR